MIWNRLSVKLSLITAVVLVLLLVVQTIITSSRLRDDMVKGLSQNTYNISEAIKNSTRNSMLTNSKKYVNQTLHDVGKNKGINAVRIYDKQGVVRYSSDSTELFSQVDIESKTCIPCHKEAIPLEKLSIEDRTQIHEAGSSKELIILNPVSNEKECYSSGCHAHTEKDIILGILEVRIPLENIDKIVDSNVSNVITDSLIGAFVVAFVIGLLITFYMNRPLKKITRGINEFANGNLKYRIKLSWLSKNDELGITAEQMNIMASKLQAAYDEINKWNETLHRKIEEKTEELKSLYNQVIQVEKLASLGKLSATVAHELNNPLAGILNFSKLIIKKLKKIQKEDEYERLIDHLELIRDESARCGRIVQDLLLFSHKDDEEFVQEDLTNIIKRSLAIVDHHLEINKIELDKHLDGGEINIECNPQKIQQSLITIMINGIEAMEPGGALKVEANGNESSAIVRIIDTGSGISEKDLPHIFEPFYTTKDSERGTGLGLSVAYGIINSHNGRIEVEKTSSEGTTFKITLPRKQNEENNNDTER